MKAKDAHKKAKGAQEKARRKAEDEKRFEQDVIEEDFHYWKSTILPAQRIEIDRLILSVADQGGDAITFSLEGNRRQWRRAEYLAELLRDDGFEVMCVSASNAKISRGEFTPPTWYSDTLTISWREIR